MAFDGFVALDDVYRTIVVVTVDNQPFQPTGTPTYRLYGPDGLMPGFSDQPLASIDTVDGIDSWSPDITIGRLNFSAGSTYRMVVRAVVDGDTLIAAQRCFTVT